MKKKKVLPCPYRTHFLTDSTPDRSSGDKNGLAVAGPVTQRIVNHLPELEDTHEACGAPTLRPPKSIFSLLSNTQASILNPIPPLVVHISRNSDRH